MTRPRAPRTLLGTPLRTTRRSDALKTAASPLALGREDAGERVDGRHPQPRYTAARITRDPDPPTRSPAPILSTCSPRDGQAQMHLKLVLLQPATATVGIDTLPDDVVAAAAQVREFAKGRTPQTAH
ncbi:hypothetical protein [Streptomyces sp. NPDC006309]|uniref:hypothetical protein n=1 Tax=Streptomyces sp. NPDC006309 TaxID=3156749 RepID=UPI0033AAF4DE